MYAAEAGYIKVVVDLVNKYHADIDDIDTKGNTPLMYAVKSGNPKVVQTILGLKADKELKNKKGLTALDIAKGFANENPEYEEIVKILDGTEEKEQAEALAAEQAKKKNTTTKKKTTAKKATKKK